MYRKVSVRYYITVMVEAGRAYRMIPNGNNNNKVFVRSKAAGILQIEQIHTIKWFTFNSGVFFAFLFFSFLCTYKREHIAAVAQLTITNLSIFRRRYLLQILSSNILCAAYAACIHRGRKYVLFARRYKTRILVRLWCTSVRCTKHTQSKTDIIQLRGRSDMFGNNKIHIFHFHFFYSSTWCCTMYSCTCTMYKYIYIYMRSYNVLSRNLSIQTVFAGSVRIYSQYMYTRITNNTQKREGDNILCSCWTERYGVTVYSHEISFILKTRQENSGKN